MITVALREQLGWPVPAPSAARRGTGPAPLSSRLDKSTLLNRMLSDIPAERRLAIRYFPKARVVQGSWGVYKPEQRKQGRSKLTPEQIADNQKRATRRAVANIRRDLLSMAADRMLTLTYRENMTDRIQALKHLKAYIRVLRRLFPHWQSVAVLELQERGAIHFHIAISGFYPVEVLRREWREIVGNIELVHAETGERQVVPNGNIDISFKPDGRGNACSKLAAYMGKYLAKDLQGGRSAGEHRYFRTQGIERPREVYYLPASAPRDEERGIIFEVIEKLLSRDGDFPEIWTGPTQSGFGGYIVGSGLTQ